MKRIEFAANHLVDYLIEHGITRFKDHDMYLFITQYLSGTEKSFVKADFDFMVEQQLKELV